jgi:hypothetical protein
VKVVLLKRCRSPVVFARHQKCLFPTTTTMSSRGPISQSSSMPSFSLLLVVVVVVVVVFVLPPTTSTSLCVTVPHQRERERSKAVPSSLYRFSKVIVIFACVPQTRAESQMSFCANELRAFFFLTQKYEHPKQCNTPDAVFL